MRLGIVGLRARVDRIERERGSEFVPPRFMIWNKSPDDPDYVDGPGLVDDFATGRTHEYNDQAELSALLAQLAADGSTMTPIKSKGGPQGNPLSGHRR